MRVARIYGHADVSKANGSKGRHWGTRRAFPWKPLLELVKSA